MATLLMEELRHTVVSRLFLMSIIISSTKFFSKVVGYRDSIKQENKGLRSSGAHDYILYLIIEMV